MPTGQASRLMPTLRRVVTARQTASRSDGELLGAFVNARDADAFAELVRRHGPMVLGVCRRLVCDHATADDAFQAVFLVLARRAAAVRPREQVGNWLYGVAYRTALKARMVLARRRSREKQVDAMPEPTATAAPTAAADWGDLQAVIDEELARLPDKLRVPVVLCDIEGRPQREVAKHLKVPPATLATRLASARRTLALRLTRRGVTLSGGALAGLLGIHGAAPAVPPVLAHSTILAGEAAASGAALDSLASTQAVQLSEGVMRMMMLAKLKAVAVTLATALVLTTSLGVGLVPAAAGDEPGPGTGRGFTTTLAAGARPAAGPASVEELVKERLEADPKADDAQFLRRLCLDVRGTLPTDVETWFFVSDEDDEKRAKVVEWMVSDDGEQAETAKRLGVPADRVKVVRVQVAEGKEAVVVEADGKEGGATRRVFTTPDGKKVVVERVTRTDAGDTLLHLLPLKTEEFRRVVVAGEGADKLKAAEEQLRKLGLPGRKDILIVNDDAPRGAQFRFAVEEPKPGDKAKGRFIEVVVDAGGGSDAEFLKRVLADVRGSGPTALELKYFTEDKDPKKRAKLLDTLLKDPAVQKKLGDEWRKKMLSFKSEPLPQGEARRMLLLLHPDGTVKEAKIDPRVIPLPAKPPAPPAPPKPPGIEFKLVPAVPAPPKPPAPGKGIEMEMKLIPGKAGEMQLQLVPSAPKPPAPPAPPKPPAVQAGQSGKYEKLVTELIAAQKSDEAILEALTLATQSRLPTDVEKKLTLAGIGSAKDRKSAWVAIAKALAGGSAAEKAAEKAKAKAIELELKLKP